MGENIAPIGTLWIIKSRKVLWKPWTWKNKPEYVPVAGIVDIKFKSNIDDLDNPVLINKCMNFSIDIECEEKDV